MTVELPGVGTEDVEITFEDGLLTIQGERHPASDSAAEKVHRAERRYGAFRRSITLPRHVQADAIEASAQDGVLQILVPKAQEVHAKRIQVRARQGQGRHNRHSRQERRLTRSGPGRSRRPPRVTPPGPHHPVRRLLRPLPSGRRRSIHSGRCRQSAALGRRTR